MPPPFRFVVPCRLGAQEVAAALDPPWRVVLGEAGPVVRHHLDTFDWALWKSGGRLFVECDGGPERLCWRPAGDRAPRTLRVEGEVRFATELPAGILRREVAAAAGLRALLPVGRTEARRALVRVVNGEGKTLVRIWLETVRAVGPEAPAGPGRRLLRVEPLTGYARAGAEVAAQLAGGLALAPDEGDELVDAAAATGRAPGDYTSKIVVRLAPDEPAERAVRRILARLLATLVANVEGTVQDLDTEFLHDLRVASRRTRTCLGQLGGTLPQARIAPFAEEFRWLGDATTPCRDLDVFLLGLEARRRSRPAQAAAALAP
ncbi:MAG: CHAD domain-containing protein, partial [Thermoanaerobaculaceae bacterium]|nr:CHAD domain-containing protein [Thermoanaerobaculaceae bacterium]